MFTTVEHPHEKQQLHEQSQLDRILSSIVSGQLPSEHPVAIVAGHYCVSKALPELSNTGAPETMSFLAGARLAKRLRLEKQESVLLLWINDIGICPVERAALKEASRIPDNYRDILEDEGISADAVTVMFESTMRNTASTDLRKILKKKPDIFRRLPSDKPNLVRCVDPSYCSIDSDSEEQFVYAVDGPQGEDLVVKEGSNPKCNFILANLIAQIVKTYGSTRIVNIFNDLYLSRIGLGIHVGRLLYDIKAEFTNLFCDDDSLYLEPSSVDGRGQ